MRIFGQMKFFTHESLSRWQFHVRRFVRQMEKTHKDTGKGKQRVMGKKTKDGKCFGRSRKAIENRWRKLEIEKKQKPCHFFFLFSGLLKIN